MNRAATRALCAATVAGCASAAAAVAAEPDKGTVSAASPKVTWVGQISEGSYFASRALLLSNQGGDPGAAPCDQGCDTFTVTVADQKDLTVGADSPAEGGDPAQTVIRVMKPDGSYLTSFGDTTAGKPLLVRFKNAPKGDYVVDVGDTYINAHEYAGQAFLGSGAPPNNGTPPPPPPLTQPVPGSDGQGQGGTQPPPASNPGSENIDLRIKPGKASARKLKKSRKLTATVTVSRPVASLTGTLKQRKTTVGKAKRGKTSGTVKVVLKLSKKAARKVRKGSFGLTFVARDGNTVASKTVKVKVRK